MSDSASVILFDAKEHAHVTVYLAAIHASCITHDRTIATFLPPLSHGKLLSWWKARIAELADGSRVIFLLLDGTNPLGSIEGPEIVGVVMLVLPSSETGPFRCLVEKLLIHRRFRGRGGARLLMSALEAEALKRRRTLLLLDTETGSPAEAVYKKLGYTEMGRIPGYGISPTGDLKEGTFFYKDISAQRYTE
ncbi:Acetyltransferase [Cordyceps militaris CM01]|uniref:Acetyltransferase n=2 Tax=Cordyceps militaris TaxID=73501 RepID=G3JEC4_CORMM|nr:Acetyltransferase [Cordyceps militaris CM01]ATY65147.1 Acetyltransferase [Cordyceps militaris]EGX92949.1 Acetyltransferase [Cordyceps militaris CM01]